MTAVKWSIWGALAAEFMNQFQALSPMSATEFGTLLNILNNPTLHEFICYHIDRKGWFYHTRNGKRVCTKDTPWKTDTIHYNGPQYTFHKKTVFRILVSK